MKENPSLWQYLEFSKICLAEHFSKIDLEALEGDIK
jgi:hypothetical protein